MENNLRTWWYFETSALKSPEDFPTSWLTSRWNNTFPLFKIIWAGVLFLADDNFLTDNISLSLYFCKVVPIFLAKWMTQMRSFPHKLFLGTIISTAPSIKSKADIFASKWPHRYGSNWVTASFFKQSTTLKAGFHFSWFHYLHEHTCKAKNICTYSWICRNSRIL